MLMNFCITGTFEDGHYYTISTNVPVRGTPKDYKVTIEWFEDFDEVIPGSDEVIYIGSYEECLAFVKNRDIQTQYDRL